MANSTTPLNDTQIRLAKPKEKEYSLGDGQGLRLRVMPTGSKRWIFNYQTPYAKKRTNIELGQYPDISLKRAREIKAEFRQLLSENIDPREHRLSIADQQKEALQNTFESVAKKQLESKHGQVTENHLAKIERSLEKYIFPSLGKVPVDKLKAPDFIKVLRPIEAKGTLETVNRLIQRINAVMSYAVNYGLIEQNPTQAISQVFKSPKKQHYPTIKPEQIGELIQAISRANISVQTRCLIEWQLHTMVRPNEAAGTRWEEIDFNNGLWTIPAERMKRAIQHTVPLTEQTLALLEFMKPISGHREHVFPSFKSPRKSMNPSTANAAIKRMGFKDILVAHGLRALASTTLNEQGFDGDLVEACLAHIDKNEVRKAYNRAEYIKRRKPIMEWWSSHIENAGNGNLNLASKKGLYALK